MNIKTIAEEIYNMYHTRDPREIVNYMDGIIVYTNHLDDNILGLSTVTNNNLWIIGVNSKIHNSQLIKFVIAHEIGHKVLHDLSSDIFLKRNTLFNLGKLENQADEFALNLLYSDEDLKDILEYVGSELFCEAFKVSHSVFEKVIRERLLKSEI
ncbi:ImmA/IrrE family metallo-endopeptidase [Thermoanaerobacter mathranii]|uniref:ImmA/IrrE family metallo-endopeptidase n=1 Tax=Thermoanaerobacter mathranii TaxID=583357 RepID=UPI003D6B4488